MGAAGALRMLPLLVLVLLVDLSSAASEKVAARTAIAASARHGQQSHEASASAVATRLQVFLEQVHRLHGRRTGARIAHLARQLESDECVYDKDLADTQKAIEHFIACVQRIEHISQKTFESASKRTRLNAEYGEDTKKSLQHISDTVQDLTDLQKSIVVEHKVAADHLAREVVAIKNQVNSIKEVNEDHQREKGWTVGEPAARAVTTRADEDIGSQSEVDPGFKKTEDIGSQIDVDVGFKKTEDIGSESNVDSGDKKTQDPVQTKPLLDEVEDKREKDPDNVMLLEESSRAGVDGPVRIKADLAEDDVEGGESLAELKQELRRVRTKIAAVHRHAAHNHHKQAR